MASAAASALKREIKPWMLIALVVGDVLGAGIYARVGEVAGQVGGAIWVSFALGLGIAGLTALSYAELSSKYPSAGGAALFVHKAFGLPLLTFCVAFAVLASGIASASSAARTFAGGYLQELVQVPALPVAFAFILVVALINFRGIGESVRVNLLLTLIELSGLVLIMGIGASTLAAGEGVPARAFEFKEGASIPFAVLAGAGIAFYACLGFEDVTNMAEEAENPSRMLPVALLGGLGLAGIVYIAVSMTAAMVVDPAALATSKKPLVEVVKVSGVPVSPLLFSAIALMAVANTALINLIMASRLLYGMAEQGVMPRPFAWTHSTRHTPWVGIVFTTLLAFGLVATGDIGPLADTTVLLLLLSFVLVHLSLLRLRSDRVAHEHFSVPAFVPVAGALTCVVLLAVTIYRTPVVLVRAGILVGIGVGLWLVQRWLNARRTPGPEGT